MGRIERHIEKERFVLVRLDEAQRLALEEVGCVSFVGDALVAAEEGGHAVPLMGEVVDARVREPVEIIEPALQRHELRGSARVPLAEDTGPVARVPHGRADGHFAHVEPLRHLRREAVFQFFVLVVIVGLVAADVLIESVALRVASGEQAAARGRAYGRGRVEVGEAHAPGGQAVDIRCSHARVAEAAEVLPCLVVAVQQHDVRARGRAAVLAESGSAERGRPRQRHVSEKLAPVLHRHGRASRVGGLERRHRAAACCRARWVAR